MKEAGVILHYTKSKVFVVEAKDKLIPETTLIDSRGVKIGVVVDVIGPINKPFLVVKPTVKNPEKYVGAHLYYIKRRRRR